jgi:hypothetical protein
MYYPNYSYGAYPYTTYSAPNGYGFYSVSN